jgi:hypothetical protein
LLLSGACASRTKILEPAVYIENRTGKPFQQIVYRECGKENDEWSQINNGDILHSGYSATIELPVDCADLRAIFVSGRIAGTQLDVKKKFPFRWILR